MFGRLPRLPRTQSVLHPQPQQLLHDLLLIRLLHTCRLVQSGKVCWSARCVEHQCRLLMLALSLHCSVCHVSSLSVLLFVCLWLSVWIVRASPSLRSAPQVLQSHRRIRCCSRCWQREARSQWKCCQGQEGKTQVFRGGMLCCDGCRGVAAPSRGCCCACTLQVVDNSADKELIEMVERDILDTNPNVCLTDPVLAGCL